MDTTGTISTLWGHLGYSLDGPTHAPVVVLANSLGTTQAMWAPQLAALTGRFRVLRYDHRGHGASAAPSGPYAIADLGGDLIDLLDALDIDRASICGLSLGGMVGMWVAAHRPERVERLVLACTAPEVGPAATWHERAATVRASGTAGLATMLFSRWFTPSLRAAHPELLDELAAMLNSCAPEGYASCCEAIAGMDQRADLERIVAPTLVVAGAADPVTPPEVALSTARAIPGAALTVLAPAAHLANLEQPERFTAALIDHLVGPAALRGMDVRREVLGDAHVDRSVTSTTPFTASFQDLITRYAWGEIWTRPGLERRTRSAITLAMLVALGRFDELAFHVPAALGNGMSEDEIGEVLLQAAIYCGVPAANSAFAVAAEALGHRGAGHGAGAGAGAAGG